MAIAGKHSRIKIMSDAPAVPFAEEATTADALRVAYSITNRTKRYWSKNDLVIVETSPDGEVWTIVTSGFRIAFAGGRIVFAVAQPVGTQVRVSGAFVTVTTAAETREYSMTINNGTEDATVLESGGSRRRVYTIQDATGSLSGFYNVNDLLAEYLLGSKKLVIELDFDSTDLDGEYYAFYALIPSKELATAVEGLVTTSTSWESDGDILIEAK